MAFLSGLDLVFFDLVFFIMRKGVTVIGVNGLLRETGVTCLLGVTGVTGVLFFLFDAILLIVLLK